MIRRDGGGLRRLTRVRGWSRCRRGAATDACSPTASPLAGGSFDVWTVGLDGNAPRLVAGGPAEQIAPAFDRSGKVTVRLLTPGESFR